MVSLSSPIFEALRIFCSAIGLSQEEGQSGLVIPHYMAAIRMKPNVEIDSRFIVQFINSTRGRKAICEKVSRLYTIRPTSLPLTYLNNVDIRDRENTILESF